MSYSRFVAVLVALVLAFAPAAAAQAQAKPDDDPTRIAAARGLAEEAFALSDKGDCVSALDRFNRAEALVRAPTLSVGAARCLVKLGRLVEASERYMAALRMPLDAAASDSFRQAQADADTERSALMARIPSLEVALEGATPNEATVTLDGALVPPALIGVNRPIDPGAHTLAARRGAEIVTEQVAVREGESARVVLRFTLLAPPPRAAPSPVSPISPGPPAAPRGAAQRIAGGILVGLGSTGLVAGSVLGAWAMKKRSELDAAGCVDGGCTESLRQDVDKYNGLRMGSSVLLISGLAVAGTGAVLLLTAPSSKPTPQVGLWVGPARVGVRARF